MGKTTGPHKGEKFWDGYRIGEKKQPNGIIIAVFHQFGERKVLVYFYDKEKVVYDWEDEVSGNWSNNYGGCWMLGIEHLII